MVDVVFAALALVLALIWGVVRFQVRSGRVLVFFHRFVYDLVVWWLFPLNWALDALCALQPRKNTWGSDTPGNRTNLAHVVTRLVAKETSFADEDLVNVFDSLPQTSVDEHLLGRTFDGRVLRTNQSVLDLAQWLLVLPLTLLGFAWGKRYRTRHIGDPLLVNWLGAVYFPLPAWGNVGVYDVVWRGRSCATMVYDHQPWQDYFALLPDGSLLGVWTSRDRVGGWFVLTPNAQLSAEVLVAAAVPSSPRNGRSPRRGRQSQKS
jgi:hypothetical protein